MDPSWFGPPKSQNSTLLPSEARSAGDAARDLHRSPRRNAPGPDAAAQRLALEQLEDREGRALGRADVEEGQDVRVGEGRHELRLALEAREPVGVAGDAGGQDLDGHRAAEARVEGAVDLAPPAPRSSCIS